MLDAALHGIAEPTRREILKLVREQELTAGDIASRFEVTRPAISQHLKVLTNAGLLRERREGTRRLYRVRLEGLESVREFLDWFWEGRLELLKDAAEREERNGPRD